MTKLIQLKFSKVKYSGDSIGDDIRVGHSGDRYIHAGSSSLGCITIVEHSKWEEIFFALIKSRKGDFDSVGILEVID